MTQKTIIGLKKSSDFNTVLKQEKSHQIQQNQALKSYKTISKPNLHSINNNNNNNNLINAGINNLFINSNLNIGNKNEGSLHQSKTIIGKRDRSYESGKKQNNNNNNNNINNNNNHQMKLNKTDRIINKGNQKKNY